MKPVNIRWLLAKQRLDKITRLFGSRGMEKLILRLGARDLESLIAVMAGCKEIDYSLACEIIREQPTLSLVWLLTGEGSVFRGNTIEIPLFTGRPYDRPARIIVLHRDQVAAVGLVLDVSEGFVVCPSGR